MNVRFLPTANLEHSGSLVVATLFESEWDPEGALPAALDAMDARLVSVLREAASQEGFEGRVDQACTFHTHGKVKADRVMLVGLGSRARFTPEVMRFAAGKVGKAALRLKVTDLGISLPDDPSMPALVRATVEGLLLGQYRFDRYRTQGMESKGSTSVDRLRLVLPPSQRKERELEEAAAYGMQVAVATNWARDLVNEPAGVITPRRLAQEAESMAKRAGLSCSIGGRKELERLKMGMFLGVAQGSAEEPQLIHIKYIPKNPKHAKRPMLALVGKAITFDSGGLSLKSAEGMVGMKTDMAGSAAVLGAMQVIAAIRPPFPVHAFMGACENMPSGTAYRPGDILISRMGKTVEITNTDAEGRLVLGDILAWANEQKPAAMVDLATLTGACMVALGHYVVGAFGDDDALMNDVLDAAREAGEEMWRLPIHDMQKDALRSEVADMKNSGERFGGAINAAVFLREFVGTTPWVHLDIAGPSQSPRERGYHLKGATGVGVRTLVELVRKKGDRLLFHSGSQSLGEK